MLTHNYRIAAHLRRCCWYGIFGGVAIGCLFYCVARYAQQRNLAEIVIVCVAFALLAAGMIVPLSWRLRVDQHGLARRFVFRWDFWTWEDFSGGQIRKLHAHTLLDPDRPRWRRRLRLECLDAEARNEVITAINAHYRLPRAPEIPDTLTIKFFFLGCRRSVVLDDAGIHLTVRGTSKEYAWQEVHEVHFTRMDPLRRDFKALQVILPDEEIELRLLSHEPPRWQGATARIREGRTAESDSTQLAPKLRHATPEEINEFFFRHVLPPRIHTSIDGEPLKKRAHIERKLRDLDKRRRDLFV